MSKNFICLNCNQRATVAERDFPLVCRCGARYDSMSQEASRMMLLAEIQTFGVGSELKELFKEVDARPDKACACEAKAAEMDRLGIEAIKANRQRYIDWLRDAYSNL